MPKLSFIMAMESEAQGLIDALGLRPFVPQPFYKRLPLKFYRGIYQDHSTCSFELTITIPGKDPRYQVDSIGTEPAAVAAFATVREFQPDILVSAGTAGSFAKHGAFIGRVYLSDSAFYFHDHRIPLPGWDKFGEGAYPSLDVSYLARELSLPLGNISSGNSLDFIDQDLAAIAAHGAILKEMEATAVAWVGYITDTPMFAIKSVTNLIDIHPDSPSEFEKNFTTAVTSLTEKTLAIIDAFARNWQGFTRATLLQDIDSNS
ncbi:5'-methylthioadenosine nucleosidase [Nitrosomonas sp. Nm33]|nr:5'-methylthioadenosine nucleosidase [Nitrosomonas sp. Nm33]